MSVICVVRIPCDLAKAQEIEESHPDVMEAILAAAQKYMTGHRRAATAGEVIDFDEFASREDYDAFIAQAGPAVARYGDLIGAPAQDKLYTIVEGG